MELTIFVIDEQINAPHLYSSTVMYERRFLTGSSLAIDKI
jgi:hypothetical protein